MKLEGMTDGFDRSILERTSHRPWPMPAAPWVMTQSWHDLLFAHWPVDPGLLRPAVPDAFDLDLFAGGAWLGVVPFYMTNVGVRGLPAFPTLSAFPELNVRTYVRVDGRAGVFFFSLDAGRRLAVAAARGLFNLPYYFADMTVSRDGGAVHYETARRGGEEAKFQAVYEPAGAAFTAPVGSVEYFLTERYCLYHHDRRGRPYRLEIHHRPWSLQTARATIAANSMLTSGPVSIEGPPALVHFARRQDVVAWMPSRLERLPVVL